MTVTLEQQIASLPYRGTAGKAFKSAACAEDLKAFQKAFVKYVGKAAKSYCKTVDNFASLQSLGLKWKSASEVEFAASLQAGRSVEKALFKPMVSEPAIGPFQALVIAEFLLRNADSVKPEVVASLIVRLADFDIPDDQAFSADPNGNLAIEPIVEYGETPFIVGLVLGFLKTSKRLLQLGRTNLATMLAESTDKDGTLHGALTSSGYYFYSSFVRVSIWADIFNESWAAKKTLALWESTLKQGSAACDHEGLLLDSEATSRTTTSSAILLQGCEFLESGNADSLAEFLRGVNGATKPKKIDRKKRRSASCAGSSQSDWAATANLRSGLTADADAIALSWSDETVQVGMSCEGRRLLTGDWNYSIKVGGQEHLPMGEWVCTCWFTDDDVAFAELEKGTTNGTRHVRQVMLSTTESIAAFVDTVTASEEDSVVEFQSQLRNASGNFASLETNKVTRELRGDSSMPQLRVIPAWLDDDRLVNAVGDCVANSEGISATASGVGGVTVPLIIDWNRKRKSSEADWNRVTVTEDRKVLSQHDAGAYRVRIGLMQLLIFRSLRPGLTLRAALGYNTSHETAYGKIGHTGVIDPLVMVESEA